MLKDEFFKSLRSQQESLKNILAYGALEDYSSYQKIVGQIQGIDKAKELFSELFHKLYDEDED